MRVPSFCDGTCESTADSPKGMYPYSCRRRIQSYQVHGAPLLLSQSTGASRASQFSPCAAVAVGPPQITGGGCPALHLVFVHNPGSSWVASRPFSKSDTALLKSTCLPLLTSLPTRGSLHSRRRLRLDLPSCLSTFSTRARPRSVLTSFRFSSELGCCPQRAAHHVRIVPGRRG